jgi:4-hydroxythreonine-4-phosphate dehydrogenase
VAAGPGLGVAMVSPLALALTLGEPAGIGPDIALMAWHRRNAADGHFLVIGNLQCLAHRSRLMGLDTPLAAISAPAEAAAVFDRALPVLGEPLGVPSRSREAPDPAAAGAVVRAIEMAVDLALDGRVAGIVTNPIHKESLYRTGLCASGPHRLSGSSRPPRPDMRPSR